MNYQNPSTCKDTNWLKFSFQNQSAKTQMLGIILNFDFLKGLVFKNVLGFFCGEKWRILDTL